jgi:hypothetical protein
MTSVHRLVAVSLFVAASSVSLFAADWRAVGTSHNAWFAWHAARLEVALPVRPSR